MRKKYNKQQRSDANRESQRRFREKKKRKQSELAAKEYNDAGKKLKKEKLAPTTYKDVNIEMEKRQEEKKAKRKGKMYWNQFTDQSIIEFNSTEDQNLRNKIYEEKLKAPFEKLVQNIFNTFKFSYFQVGPEDIQKETVTHLIQNISKFDHSKGFKAFSYFSIVAKNYLIALNNSTYKKQNIHVSIDEQTKAEEGEMHNSLQLPSHDDYEGEEMKEFIKLMVNWWDKNTGVIFSKPRDLRIARAVIELFRQSERLDVYNKKALYLYVREISGCATQQITKVINRMQQHQNKIYKDYLNRGVVEELIFNK